MQKYTFIIFFIISNLTFGQDSKDRTESYIKKFRKELKEKNIDEFFVVNQRQYGIVPSFNKTYAFWEENNVYWLKVFDNNGGFIPIKLNNGKALVFYQQNFENIKIDEVETYKWKPDSIINGKKYSFNSSQSHSLLKYYWFFKGKVKFKKFINEYDLTTSEKNPNISYEKNKNLELVKLNIVCDEIIEENVKTKKIVREK